MVSRLHNDARKDIKVSDSLDESTLISKTDQRYSNGFQNKPRVFEETMRYKAHSTGHQKIQITNIFVGVLGATGAVGTRFILLLEQHPLLELVAVGASEKSADKKYLDAVRWKQSTPMPSHVGDLIVRRCVPSEFPDCDIIFSGLDAEVAGDVEMAFLKADFAVFSNAKNYRLAPLVPLIVPLVNLGHIESVPSQRQHYQLNKGLLVCNSNCAVVGLVIPAAALIQKFGPIDQVSMVTLQALSGAGYPGVSSK